METSPIGALFEPTAGQVQLESDRLGQKDFLAVLVAQLRNQNPLEPQTDTDFIAQIAMFEQLTSLNHIEETIAITAGLNELQQASGLLGREVVSVLSDGTPLVGIVDAIELIDGEPLLRVGEALVSVFSVTEVHAEPNVEPANDGGEAGEEPAA